MKMIINGLWVVGTSRAYALEGSVVWPKHCYKANLMSFNVFTFMDWIISTAGALVVVTV